MSREELEQSIIKNIEWLETTEQDEVECISIENLEAILTDYFGVKINLKIE